MNEEQWNIIRPIVDEALKGVFKTVSVPINDRGEAKNATLSSPGIAVSIGITSAQIRGGIALVLPMILLEDTHPLRKTRRCNENELRDWACEMTNQLAGRVKNRMGAHGIFFRISTPMAVLGNDLRMPDHAIDPVCRALEFVSLGFSLYVHFAARITPGAILNPHPVKNEGDMAEGAFAIF